MIDQFFQTIENILESCIVGLDDLFRSTPKGTTEYGASFGSEGTLLSSFNHGFNVSGRKKLTAQMSHRNFLGISSTGGGKTSTIMLPTLFSTKGSFIVNDPSGELFQKSSGYLQQKGYRVMVLDYTKWQTSAGFNGLILATSQTKRQKLAKLTLDTSKKGAKADPFWDNLAESLLSTTYSLLHEIAIDEYINMANARHLLNLMGSNPEAVDELYKKYASDSIFSEYTAFLRYDQKVVDGVIATAKSALTIFADESVGKTTSFNSIDWHQFRKSPHVLYINNSIADAKFYAPLTSFLFSDFLSYGLSRFPEKNELDIFLLIDEMASMHIDNLGMIASNVRKHRIGILGLIQTFSQLEHLYGKAEAQSIRTNSSQLYMPGQELPECQMLETLLGKHEFIDKDGKKQIYPLMTSDAIRNMKDGILVAPGYLPVKVRLTPYFKQSKFNSYSKIPPVTLDRLAPSGPVPLLPISLGKNEQAA